LTPFSPKDTIFIIPDGAAREDHHEYTKEDFYNRLIDGVLYSKKKPDGKEMEATKTTVTEYCCFVKYVSSIHHKCSSLTLCSQTVHLLETGDLFRPIRVRGLFIDEV
jgi:hypothetical protein